MKTVFLALLLTVVTSTANAASKVWNKELTSVTCSYNLATTGNGTVGTHAVCNLPDKFVVALAIADTGTGLTGGGTLVVGEDGGGDADGYWTDLDAVAGVVKGSGALIASVLAFKVDAAKDGVLLTVGTTAYTAGIIKFTFIGFQGE